jgi:hypothetical protein
MPLHAKAFLTIKGVTGVDAIDTLRLRGIYNFGSSLQGSFIGASRRDLLTTLTRDTVELAKVMRFFS